MIGDIREINFPPYATLESATATIVDMGESSISTQVKINGDAVPDFSYNWEVEFKGEKYIHPVRKPQGTKDNTSMSAKIDMVFYHWAIYEMKRHYFIEMASTAAGTIIADKYISPLRLNLGKFVVAFNLVLNYYFGNKIVINLNPDWEYDTEAKGVDISYSYIWDILQQVYEIYGVRWTLKTNADGICEILMGYPAEEIAHVFQYGFEGGLLSVQRQVQSSEIRNRLLGRGGEKNLPYRYFKAKDENNPLFEADPDWVPELANIAFTELRGKTFRDYVKGWKAKNYGGTPMDDPTEEYLAGYNAEKFDPIEYVEDEESITKYGVLVGALENNEEIYPSIQGAPGNVDAIVDAEQVVDDNIESSVTTESVVSNIADAYTTVINVAADTTVSIDITSRSGTRAFTVPENSVGEILLPSFSAKGKAGNPRQQGGLRDVAVSVEETSFSIHRTSDNIEISSINIPPGDYYIKAVLSVKNISGSSCNITATVSGIKLNVVTTGSVTNGGWKPTFDIWVRNIWGSSRKAGETDRQYADRVWLPILGDRMGDEARVVFASGWLSFSSDWEFPIVGYAYDDSKTDSHWRLTLAKSEAELEASGKYIPYEGYNASAGDRFFFIGIDMPYQYVLWAEERLDDYKRDSLLKTSDINPTWVIKTDKVRLNEDREGAALVDSLRAGSQIRLASKQFISGAYENLYVQSVTYTWGTDTILHPDVEVVVSDKVYAVKNPVAQIQSSIETIQRQVGSLSNIQQIIRQVCDQLYLRKDGIKDISLSPTEFRGLVSGQGFRQGNIGGAGWGFYRDANGRSVAEVDKLVVRNDIEVNNLVVNEVTHIGGEIVYSMANMICSAVEETENGYRCFFDQKQGTIVNLFAINDIVWCQKFEPDNTSTKYYKRIVTEVSETYIVLSKSPVDGNDIPSINDNIIHFGNTTNKDRQSAIIINPRNGGSITIFAGIDSFDITDRNYVGMGVNPVYNKAYLYGYGDCYFGSRNPDEGNFMTFQNGKMNINADVTFGSDSTGLSNLGEWQDLQGEVAIAQQNAQNAQESANTANASILTLDTRIDNVDGTIKEINNKLDGVVESYFDDYTPSRNNEPALTWITEGTESAHIGDTFTNTALEGDDAGKSWRWLEQSDGTYDWQQIADSDAAKALALASQAQAAADGKTTTFLRIPSNYKKGDVWIVGDEIPDGSSLKKGDILVTNSDSVDYLASHWSKYINYTDEFQSELNSEVATLNQAIDDAESAAKGYTDEGKAALRGVIDALDDAKANATDVYTKAQADNLISAAEEAAMKASKDYTDAAQELAEITMKAYADGVANDAELAAIKEAQANLDDAKEALDEAIAEVEEIASEASRLNLLANSAELSYTYAASSSLYGRKYLPFTVNAGETYTFKCELAENLDTSDGVDTFSVGMAGTNSGLGSIATAHQFTFGKNLVCTFKINEGVSDVKADLFFWKTNAPRVAKARFVNFSLVKGTAAMPLWQDYQGDNGLKNLISDGTTSFSITAQGVYGGKVFSFKNLAVDQGQQFTFKCKRAELNNVNKTSVVVYLYGYINKAETSLGRTNIALNQATSSMRYADDVFCTMVSSRSNADFDNGVTYLKIYPGDGNTLAMSAYSLVKGTRPMMVWKENTDYLTNAFKNGTTKISGGLVMTQAVMVEDGNGTVKGLLNGSSVISDSTHGTLIVAAGSSGSSKDALNSATTRIYEDGRLVTKDADVSGHVEATSGSFTDIAIKGTIRSAFQGDDGALDWDDNIDLFADNIAFSNNNLSSPSTDSRKGANQNLIYASNIELGWDVSQIGRRRVIVNHKYTSYTDSILQFKAPSGKYFYENGHRKSVVYIYVNDMIELLGYGVDNSFFGWIVVNRIDLSNSYSDWKPEGMYAGLRPNTRDVSDGDTLDKYDHTVYITGGTINLPSSPLKGQFYRIYHYSTSTLTINGNGKNIRKMLVGGPTSDTSVTSTQCEVVELHLAGTNWYASINHW